MLASRIGMDPVQFGVMVVFNVTVGLATPPVGMALFVTQKVANITTKQMFKSIMPFLVVMIITLFIIAFVPQITTFIPNLLIK